MFYFYFSMPSHPTSENPLTVKPKGLQGPLRRVIYVGLYELIAIAVSSQIFILTGQDGLSSGVMAVAASLIAVTWNVTFNYLFEYWESRQSVKGRSIWRRTAHAIGFEGGLGLILIPIMAWWFNISLWAATVMEAGLLIFFLIYTWAFTWCFDRIFGLPASAQALDGSAP